MHLKCHLRFSARDAVALARAVMEGSPAFLDAASPIQDTGVGSFAGFANGKTPEGGCQAYASDLEYLADMFKLLSVLIKIRNAGACAAPPTFADPTLITPSPLDCNSLAIRMPLFWDTLPLAHSAP